MRLEWVRDIDRFVPEWRALHRSCPTAHPFHSPEWVTTWYRTVGRLFWPRILAGYEGDDLVFVWPLAATLRTWYVAGTGVSDYLDPLSRSPVTPEDCAEINAVLMEFRPTLLDLHQLPEEFPAFEGAEVFEQATCMRRTLPATYDQFLKSLGSSLRQDVRKSTSSGELVMNWVEPGEFFPVFFELHRQRWAAKRLPGAFILRGRQRFHEGLAEHLRGNELFRFGVLRHNGDPIGALYGMTSGNRAFFYQSGFDPKLAKLSPGTAMVASFFQRSIDDGLEVFDFLRGDERYKQRWKPDIVAHNLRHIWPAEASLVGNVAKMHHKVDRWLREKLEG